VGLSDVEHLFVPLYRKWGDADDACACAFGDATCCTACMFFLDENNLHFVALRLQDELLHAHIEAEFAWKKGATETEMAPVLKFIRQSQWRWDYGVASHGASFHAPQEVTRILSAGLERAMKARLALSRILAKHGYTDEVPMPDISTKEKAQRYIGLNPEELRRKKGEFLKTVVPKWIEEARKKNRIMTADASRS